MEFKKFDYNITILEKHLDTFGHVNNAVYLEIFEEARWDLITKNGYGLKEVQERKIGPVILEINIKFIKELKLRETIRIETQVTEYGGKVGNIRQIMWRGDEMCCEFNCKAGLFDLKQRKLIDPTPEWKNAIGVIG